MKLLWKREHTHTKAEHRIDFPGADAVQKWSDITWNSSGYRYSGAQWQWWLISVSFSCQIPVQLNKDRLIVFCHKKKHNS